MTLIILTLYYKNQDSTKTFFVSFKLHKISLPSLCKPNRERVPRGTFVFTIVPLYFIAVASKYTRIISEQNHEEIKSMLNL